MPIKDWSSTAASNNSAPPNGAPENMAPSAVNDTIRQVMADVRAWYEASEWLDFGHTPTFVSATAFTVTGDQTDTYQAGRRVRITDASTLYGTITATAYVTITTVAVVLDSGDITASISAIAVGASAVTSPALAAGSVKNFPRALYYADTGAADAYVITPIPAVSALTTGDTFSFKATNACTGASTLAIGSATAVAMKKSAGNADLAAGDIIADQMVTVVYDGGTLQITSDLRKTYTSAQQTLTASSTVVLPHLMGAVPRHLGAKVICTDAGGDNNYAQNDVIFINPSSNSDQNNTHALQFLVDTTNVTVIFSTTLDFIITDQTAFNKVELDPTKWALIVEAST